jgi:hypothetical protein
MRRPVIASLVGAALVGSATVAVAATPAMACSQGDVCFYTQTGLNGSQYHANPSGYSTDTFYSLRTWYPQSHLGSVWNRWSNRIYLTDNKNPGVLGGPNLCYPPNGSGSPNETINYVYFTNNPGC